MRARYLVTLLIFLGSFALIIVRLFYWQVVHGQELSDMGLAQYQAQLQILPQRGDIQTSDNFPIATHKTSYLLFANPKEIKDKIAVANEIASALHIDVATVSADLRIDKYWVAIKSQLSQTERQSIEQLHIPGVGFQDEASRYYPEASMAAQLLGFVGKDQYGNYDKGYFGLEGFYDRQLKGRPGEAVEIHDAFGNPVLAKLNGSTGAQDGRTLVLHIDRVIQYLVESKLRNGVEKFGATSGMVTVMDPKTGGILAMASFPSFDPRNYQDYPEELYKNPFVSDLYEPGSTFKPLIMAAALDSGKVTPQTTCPICSAPVKIGDYEIHTWNDTYDTNIDMTDTIIHSDNTGMVYVAKLLGLDPMVAYLSKFGIGSVTNIDLQGEAAPGLREQKPIWYPVDIATLGFGQGITVTPIELLDGFSAFANGGKRMEPHIVSQIITPEGDTIAIPAKVDDQPISAQTAKVMTEILVQTVNTGEAQFARIKGYRIAGKTGTASIPKDGRYDPTQTIASFIGYAPADDPKFSMLVIFNKPTTSIYGAETAAPVFFDIAKDILLYYGIAPTGDQ